ncbi:hypothetical protein MWN41_00395 [Ornithobacterium rhinotracheale]|uniref:hypothetical protein n=1 Tax=Ornithobacterium rhinotracheale TaxID=28251 RepID=UPI001FF34D88|nr:hypothetical protein [Ornithobacterium rhinotracheale]MCK0201482.1 hypothetical protein [Ornithobacterium rhinotracheale]
MGRNKKHNSTKFKSKSRSGRFNSGKNFLKRFKPNVFPGFDEYIQMIFQKIKNKTLSQISDITKIDKRSISAELNEKGVCFINAEYKFTDDEIGKLNDFFHKRLYGKYRADKKQYIFEKYQRPSRRNLNVVRNYTEQDIDNLIFGISNSVKIIPAGIHY